jgi:hypothetical protein
MQKKLNAKLAQGKITGFTKSRPKLLRLGLEQSG